MSRKTKMDNASKLINIISDLMEKQERLLHHIGDLEDYKITEDYDVICALFSIHFLPKMKVYKLIKNMQEKTRKNGYNFVGVFRKGKGNNNKYQFSNGELSSMYSDWKIINYNEFSKSERHGKGPIHSHEISNLITQKN